MAKNQIPEEHTSERTPPEILRELRAEREAFNRETTEQGKKKRQEKIAKLVREFRMSLSLTVQELSSRLAVSVQSVHRWEREDLPPLRADQLHKFQKVLDVWEDKRRRQDGNFVELGGRFLAVRPITKVVETWTDATEVWVVRGRREFLGGVSVSTRWKIADLIRDKNKMPGHAGRGSASQSALDFYFIYPPKDNSPEPCESFMAFRDWLKANGFEEVFKKHVHGYQIPLDLTENKVPRFNIGLSGTYGAWIVVVYDRVTASKKQRNADIFLEIRVAVLTDRSGELEEAPGKDIWIQLPERDATRQYDRMRKAMDKITQELKRTSNEQEAC